MNTKGIKELTSWLAVAGEDSLRRINEERKKKERKEEKKNES